MTALPERYRSEAHAAFQSVNGHGSARPVTTEDVAIVQFETDLGAVGTTVISQVSAGRKNRLLLELDGAHEALEFNQEEPESLWVGTREYAKLIKRDPETLSDPARPYATLPGGHPQGYGDCFNAFVAEVYAAAATGDIPDGLPQFKDGLRAARLTEAVLTSAREQRWVEIDVPAALALV